MMTYGEAVDRLGNRNRRKIDRNTYLRREPGGVLVVRYHATDIIRFSPDGSAVYNSGGWLTYSTKERMNAYGPARIHSEGGLWLVSHKSDPLTAPKISKCRKCHGTGELNFPASYTWWDYSDPYNPVKLDPPVMTSPAHTETCWQCKGSKVYDYGSKSNPVRYFDGMSVNASGKVIAGGKKLIRQYTVTAQDRRDARTMKAISGYVALYTDERLRELYDDATANGTSGDCLFCQMGGMPGDPSHLTEHIREGYTMATLARNAIERKGYINPAVIMVSAGELARRAIREYMINELMPSRAGSHPVSA